MIVPRFYFTEIEMVVSCLLFFIHYLKESHIRNFHFFNILKDGHLEITSVTTSKYSSDIVGPEFWKHRLWAGQ